jgi:2-keto-4-pentenoate hydratase/2-oxohepta-3-ene-1,7-dioic acid hydratase in catechol pathway
MKFATLASPDGGVLCALDDDGAHKLIVGSNARPISDVADLFGVAAEGGFPARGLWEALSNAHVRRDGCVDLTSAVYLCPVARPEKVLGLWLNYGAGPFASEVPLFFAKFANALVPHGGVIPLPTVSTVIGWEPELAVVVGARASCLDEAAARTAIGGYTIANDVTAFDHTLSALLRSPGPYLIGKSFDGFCPIGPYLVTADEVGDGRGLSVRLWVDGELRLDDSTTGMTFSPAEVVSYLSWRMTLQPGDIILMGSPQIRGERETGKPNLEARTLKPGQQIRIEIEQLGQLRNSVVEQRPVRAA